MPRALAVYNAIPTSETVQFQLPSGEGKQFVVWKDIDSEAKLVKCDLCDRLMPLQGQSMSTTHLKRHRNGAGCKQLIRQNANQNSGSSLSFINTFQDEVGPSNVLHVPCEFLSCFQVNIILY